MDTDNSTTNNLNHELHLLSIEDLKHLLQGRPGLIIGPGVSMGAGCMSDLLSNLKKEQNILHSTDIFSLADVLLVQKNDLQGVKDSIKRYIANKNHFSEFKSTARVKWSSVLSACWDSYFENELQLWCEKSPARPNVTTLSDYFQPCPPRSILVQKLLGTIVSNNIIISSNDYRINKVKWNKALDNFTSFVKGQPVLCIGMSECPNVMLDLLAAMLSDHRLRPGPLLFLKDDPITQNELFIDFHHRGITMHVLSITIEGFLSCLAENEKHTFTTTFSFKDVEIPPIEQLNEYRDIAIVVNSQLRSSVIKSDVNLLKNLLFSPEACRWEPYIYNYDFRRTITSSLLEKTRNLLHNNQKESSAVYLYGASATGKTTLLKRAAYDLACENYLTLWFRPYFFQDGTSRLKRLIDCIKKNNLNKERKVIVFIDDPIGLISIKIKDIKEALEEVNIGAVFIIATRSTDRALSDIDAYSETYENQKEIYVPEVFDEIEWNSLPQYLVNLGICTTIEDAKQSITIAVNRGVRDILSALFWLLPDTRSHIKNSVRNEHLRLGDRSAFSQLIVGEINQTSRLLKDAYELVSVTSKYGIPMPIEILVAALDVDYDKWLIAEKESSFRWGLLYEETSEDKTTILYKTRNDVVTDIVVETINGGHFGHSGEFVRLKRLIDTCTGSSPVYREFCISLLVPYDVLHQSSRLEYAEGLELYEKAIKALPYEDRTLVHHMGLWQKNIGHLPLQAIETLNRAINTKVYPYASRFESTEHIYTSVAATHLDAITDKCISVEEGKQKAFAAIERARPEQFFNPYTTHVQARLIIQLADVTGAGTDPDSIKLIDTALSDVDRMLLLLLNDKEHKTQIDLLEKIRLEILDRCIDFTLLEEATSKMWVDFKRQDGFVLMARKLYGEALQKNKGHFFKQAFDYCLNAQRIIQQEGMAISSEFAEVMLHIYFQWRIRRSVSIKSSDTIDWKLIEALSYAVINNSRYRGDPIYSYFIALAKSHQNDWVGANLIFDELRRRKTSQVIFYKPLDYLMSPTGGIQKLQGIVKKGSGRDFLHVDSLQTDFLLDRQYRWAAEEQIDHAYIQFRFAGPIAVKEL